MQTSTAHFNTQIQPPHSTHHQYLTTHLSAWLPTRRSPAWPRQRLAAALAGPCALSGTWTEPFESPPPRPPARRLSHAQTHSALHNVIKNNISKENRHTFWLVKHGGQIVGIELVVVGIGTLLIRSSLTTDAMLQRNILTEILLSRTYDTIY